MSRSSYPKVGQAVRITYHGGTNLLRDSPTPTAWSFEGTVTESPESGSVYITLRPFGDQQFRGTRQQIARSGDFEWTDGFGNEQFSITDRHITISATPFQVYWSWVAVEAPVVAASSTDLVLTVRIGDLSDGTDRRILSGAIESLIRECVRQADPADVATVEVELA